MDNEDVLHELKGIKYLLKFGENEHIRQFVDGSLYYSSAKTFWEIEDKMKIKGQGDQLEATMVVHSQNVKVFDDKTNENYELPQKRIQVIIKPAEGIPVFCLFAVKEEECNGDGIRLSLETQETIKKHFPKADSVAIISNPSLFVQDVVDTIGTEVKFDMIHYYDIDNGCTFENSQSVNNMEYFYYLTQDTPPIKENGEKILSLTEDNVFRILFCKDIFFQNESEFRIVLPKENIDKGISYAVTLSENINVMKLEEFFELMG